MNKSPEELNARPCSVLEHYDFFGSAFEGVSSENWRIGNLGLDI